MSRVHRKKRGPTEASSNSKRRPGHSGRRNKKSFADGLLDASAARAQQERLHWLNKPRLHTAIFAEARRDEELEELLANNGANFKDKNDAEVFARQKEKRRHEINAKIGLLGWSLERLNSFTDAVVAYRENASIQNYLSIRREFPEVEIQVARFGGIEALFALEADFKDQGINPNLIAGALDGDEPSVDALCLRLLELISERDELPKNGPGYIERRRSAISDASISYLITTILEAYDWNEDVYRVPASLVVLIRHQLCGLRPDLEVEYKLREHKKNVAMAAARLLKPDERLSINKLKELAGISRTTAARWLGDPSFQRWLDFSRKHESGLFEAIRKAASKTRQKE